MTGLVAISVPSGGKFIPPTSIGGWVTILGILAVLWLLIATLEHLFPLRR